MCLKQDGAIYSSNDKHLKLVDFIYHGSNISSTENNANIHIGKVWTIRLSSIRKSTPW